MQNLTFLIVAIFLGICLKKFEILKNDAHLVINNLLLYICLPSATLLYTTETTFNTHYILPILMPWILFVCSFIFFQVLAKFITIHPHTLAVLILTAGIPSVSFVGFPIFEMLYGQEGLKIGILMSQSGSFLVCSTLGIIVASYYASAKPTFKTVVINVLKFPTFIAFCVAILLNLTNVHFPPIIAEILKKLASPLSFLALISIGLQIDFSRKGLQISSLKWGLCYKLIVAPVIIILFYVLILKQKGQEVEVSILGAALGPMNTVAIIASNYKLNPTLAAQMVGIGIPLSLITTMILHFLLN